MAERDEQLHRRTDVDADLADLEADLGSDLGADADTGSSQEPGPRHRRSREDTDTGGRLRGVAGRLVSGRSFVVALLLSVLGSLLFGRFVPLPFGLDAVGTLLGVFLAAFVYGAASTHHRYAETALAGGLVAGGAALLDTLVLAALGIGLPVVVLGTVGGLLAGLAGHYFGRDLRDGLTRDI